jgi:hypothetical protein
MHESHEKEHGARLVPAVLCLAWCLACSETRSQIDAVAGGNGGAGGIGGAGGGGAAQGIALPEPNMLPIGASDVVRMGPAIELDVTSAIVASGTSSEVVFDSFDLAFERGSLFRLSIVDGHIAPWIEMDAEAVFTTTPSFVAGDLYFMASASRVSLPSLHVERGGARETHRAPEGVASLLSWPRFRAHGTGGIALAFRDAASVPMFAAGERPASFDPPVAVGPDTGGALAAVGVFASGALAFSYQHPTGNEPMVSYVVTSTEGATWSDPVRVTDASSNVHDTTLVARDDGALDLYYIYPAAKGFALFRRALDEGGALGPEERVTGPEVREPSKPEALRLPSGRVLIAYAEISERDRNGYPSRQSLVLASLPGEAPR